MKTVKGQIFIFVFVIVLFQLPFHSYSQGEWNQWRFGINAGLDFNSTPPVAVSGSAMTSFYPTVSVADSLGALLFYSNGGAVWNRNNLAMQNGGGLYGNSSAQMVYSIKDIGLDSTYYLFTIGPWDFFPSMKGLFYSKIDMRLASGLGGVVSGFKNISIPGGENVASGICATRHQNNKDAWMVVRSQSLQMFLSYLLTSAGLNNTPIISPSFIINPMQGSAPGNLFIKISQDGLKLVSIYLNDTTAEFCQFNRNTGQVLPLFKFNTWYRGHKYETVSAEFSRDSKKLYISATGYSSFPPTFPKSLLFQYNTEITDSIQFMQSGIVIDSTMSEEYYFGLQLANDGKIYTDESNVDSVGVIHNPNNPGPGCNFQKNAISLNGNDCIWGLPQFLQKYKAYMHWTGNCQHDSVQFSGDIWPTADTINWNFGDPASGATNVSTLATPSHLFTSSGTYTVKLYIRHNDHRTDTTWRAITIYPSPEPLLGPDRTICTGNTVTFDAGFCSSCTYEWKDVGSGLVVGTNQTLTTGIDGLYCVNVTNGSGCTGKDTVQLSSTPVPLVTNSPPLIKSICTGESTNIPLYGNEPGIMFHWTANLTSGNVSGFLADSGLVINQILINNGATPGGVTYHITPKIGDCEGFPVDFTVTVNVGDPVDVFITASGNTVCAGTPVTFTANPVNPGTTPVYQWKVNGINAGSNTTTYNYVPANGDNVSCILTSSNIICTSNNPATSNTITMMVNQLESVSVSVSSSLNPVCAGTAVNFTAVPVNGGSSPQYLWKVNGLIAGTNSPNYSYVPVNGNAVTCTLTSNVLCPSGNPATSNPVVMAVNPILPVGISILASFNPFCAGSSVTFTATSVNGGISPGYQWKVNGINTGSNSPVLIYPPANGDVVICSLLSSETCTTGNPAQSTPVTMVVNANIPAVITIVDSSNPFCQGSSVTFTATPGNGGPSPIYQWLVNGANVGTNSPIFTYNPYNNDSVRCIMTSNLNCVTSNPASSGKIIMIGLPTPNVTFTTCFDTVTTISAKPFKLKGGTPLGGTFSGPGVNPVAGVFTPSTAGTGLKTILYTYTNVFSCSANMSKTILVKPNSTFTCGNNLIDIRDNKIYPTVQIGAQCWMQTNLNFGSTIVDLIPQTDNCISERYFSIVNSQSSFYQWDELMRYTTTPASQGLCPPSWHVPTSSEWDQLLSFYNGSGLAGGTLKDDLLPNGFQSHQAGFLYLNNTWAFTTGLAAGTMYWTSTSSGTDRAVARGLNEYNMSVSRYEAARGNGFALRCIRD